ncbi:hypothetical protein DOM21_04530 [Bacteriovorax stolpii]|uniref:Uncharacterized protein n=1 Tax=Bacteriovorax stolpii TaxID=960 RepID=A0A2K9NUX5_BACTC|nr:hypothetical protein [Bacteriovorax stolpii]AUN99287.1 hypothetical protein C0V70_14470 [Bacteriovorax stolpii]QDK40732.1 hypothetical protein DOM21_04530 [Bacteriovorax stolpii]TDP55173.1 hypothetical protein C8D79_0216 [Bacteriovorax stolpii]
MFYLIQFFKILFKSPVRGFFLFFFSILFVFSIGQKNYLEEQFTRMIPENKAGDYFYALIASSESYQSVARQMSALPGVFKVEILSEAQIKEEVKNILGSLQVDMTDSNLDLNYAGLKVIYTKDLKPRAKDLVRDYLSHLVGEGNITLGAIKSNDQIADKRAQFIGVIKTWGYSLYLFIVFIFWTISLLSVRAKIAEASYLLESYQRKKKVGLKMALNGLTLIFILSVAFTFILGMPQLINLLVALAVFIVGIFLHAKRYQWESRS